MQGGMQNELQKLCLEACRPIDYTTMPCKRSKIIFERIAHDLLKNCASTFGSRAFLPNPIIGMIWSYAPDGLLDIAIK